MKVWVSETHSLDLEHPFSRISRILLPQLLYSSRFLQTCISYGWTVPCLERPQQRHGWSYYYRETIHDDCYASGPHTETATTSHHIKTGLEKRIIVIWHTLHCWRKRALFVAQSPATTASTLSLFPNPDSCASVPHSGRVSNNLNGLAAFLTGNASPFKLVLV